MLHGRTKRNWGTSGLRHWVPAGAGEMETGQEKNQDFCEVNHDNGVEAGGARASALT